MNDLMMIKTMSKFWKILMHRDVLYTKTFTQKDSGIYVACKCKDWDGPGYNVLVSASKFVTHFLTDS
jgi:hypothetical protein